MSDWTRLLTKECSGIEHEAPFCFASRCSIGCGGFARAAFYPANLAELLLLIDIFKREDVNFFVLGNMTNVLPSDGMFEGAVVFMGKLKSIGIGESVFAMAGVKSKTFLDACERHGRTGAEFLAGIPCTIGGAVFMNAGAYDGQMAGIVESTEYLDAEGNIHTLRGEEHGFGYRRSIFRDHPDWTVLRSVIRLQPGDSAAILDKMNDFSQRRRDKQPLNFPSAGSTFKRPEGYFAGKLIEDAGLKGASVGAAQVSEKHAGFLINRGGATCDDMLRLIELVQERVREQFGVELECEVRIVR